MSEVDSGLFAIAGALIGGLFTYLAARVGHDWSSAQRHVRKLCEQVASYHALEQEYMKELYKAEPERGAPRTIQRNMRDRVEGPADFCRPNMTTKEARELRKRY